MSTATRPNRPEQGIPPLPVRRFSVDEYHRLIDLGILAHDEKCELLEGWIVPKAHKESEDESAFLDPEIPPVSVRKFTVDEYHRMLAGGFFDEDNRFELLEGWIVPKMPRNPPHDVAILLADEQIRPRLPAGWILRIQSAITTIESEPEPDLAVVRGVPRDFLGAHPAPSEIAFAVEVSESSLRRDRSIKAQIYAHAGIPIYVIVNLVQGLIEVYTNPVEDSYQIRRDFVLGESISLTIGDLEIGPIAVADLLP